MEGRLGTIRGRIGHGLSGRERRLSDIVTRASRRSRGFGNQARRAMCSADALSRVHISYQIARV